jgi:hypothetical protein
MQMVSLLDDARRCGVTEQLGAVAAHEDEAIA